MSFVARARKSRERGDVARAVLSLCAGLRREPDREDAVGLLVELVRDEVDSGGMEHEIAQVLATRPDRDDLLSEMVAGLERREQDKVAERLRAEGERRGMVYTPPPEPEPEPEPEQEPKLQPGASEEAEEDESRDEDEGEGEPETVPAEPSGPSAEELAAAERARAAVEKGREERAAKRARRTMVVVVAGLLVGALAVALYVWRSQGREAELAEAEGRIASFDTFGAQSREYAARVPEQRATDLGERHAFVRALAHEGQRVDDGWTTAWGWSAAALRALEAGDVEKAIELTTRAERLFPEAVAAMWARARVEEAQGEYDAARAAAEKVLDRFPKFTPAHELIARIAARRLEFDELRAVVERLAQVSKDHPYKALLELETPAEALLGPPRASDEQDGLAQIDGQDAFLKAAAAYRRAVTAPTAAGAAEAAKEAAAHDPGFAAAHLVLGAAQAANGDVEQAAKTFQFAATTTASASPELRALIQAVAPLALTGAGRPDWAARFTTPFPKLRVEGVEDRFDEQVGEERPVLLRKSAVADSNVVPAAVDALYARVEVARQSGEYGRALATLRELDRLGIDPPRARALARTWALESSSATGWEPTVENEGASAVVAAAEDFRAGRYRAAAAAPTDGLPDWAKSVVTRYRLEAMLRLGLAADVLAELDSMRVGLAHRPALEGLRLRARARTGQEAPEDSSEPQSIDRIVDRAFASFARKNLKEAESWLEKTAKLDPGNRDAAWLCGLVNATRGRDEAAAECFQRSGREASEATILLERARYAQDREEWKEARTLYERALATEPSLTHVHIDIARVAMRQQDAESAQKHLQQYLELDPHGPDAAWARQQLKP